jgi:transposase-like protein
MRKQRSFSPEFRRQVIEELLSGISTPAQICRRHEISSGLLYHWKREYGRGNPGSNGKQEAALEERIRQLEQMLGKAYLENEFLKKALQRTLGASRKRGSSLPTTETCSKPSRGGASS